MTRSMLKTLSPTLVTKAGVAQRRIVRWRCNRTSSTPKLINASKREVTVTARARLAKSDGRSILAKIIWAANCIRRVPVFWASSQPTPANTRRVRPMWESLRSANQFLCA